MDLDKLKALGLRPFRSGISRADDRYLEDLEALRERRVPASYEQFLVDIGPSYFEKIVGFKPIAPCPWADDDGLLGIEVMYGKSDDPGRDVIDHCFGIEGLPGQALVLGRDAFGNNLLLCLDDTVQFFDHETTEVFLCASDFDVFLDSLQLVNQK